jgi:hypothetical protein
MNQGIGGRAHGPFGSVAVVFPLVEERRRVTEIRRATAICVARSCGGFAGCVPSRRTLPAEGTPRCVLWLVSSAAPDLVMNPCRGRGVGEGGRAAGTREPTVRPRIEWEAVHGYGVASVRQVFEEYFSRGEERPGANNGGVGRRSG